MKNKKPEVVMYMKEKRIVFLREAVGFFQETKS